MDEPAEEAVLIYVSTGSAGLIEPGQRGTVWRVGARLRGSVTHMREAFRKHQWVGVAVWLGLYFGDSFTLDLIS